MTSTLNVSNSGRENQLTSPRRIEIRLLFAVAACLFTATVLIGMLNGQRVVQLSQDVLLTHVHAGTLGWITLGVFALSLWLFGEGEAATRSDWPARFLSGVAVVAIPCYIAAFLSGNLLARAVFGVPVLLVIAGFFGWAIVRARRAPLDVARLAVLGAYVTVTIGASLGVLLQIAFATGQMFLPTGAFAAHPGALVTGYLALVGMAVSEWRLRSTGRDDRRMGIAQISCFFASGLLLMVALLFDLVPLLALNTLLLLVGVILYLLRFGGRVFGARWTARTSERYFAASAIFLLVNVGLTISLVVGLVTGVYTTETVPGGVLLAMDHTMFIGVMTNALFGLIHDAVAERPAARSWASDVIFWGLNLGLAGFAVALITQTTTLYRIFTPIMGLGILVAIALFAWLLIRQPARERIAPAA